MRRRFEREEKRRGHADLRFEPDAAAVTFDDPLGDREADATAFIEASLVQALEHLE